MKGRKGNNKGNKGGKDVEELDPRFKTDIRFLPVAKNATKVKLDKRFESMFTSDSFKTRTEIDQYGNKISKKSDKEDYSRYYKLEQDELDEVDEKDEDEEQEDEEQEDEIEKKKQKKTTKLQKKLNKEKHIEKKSKKSKKESEELIEKQKESKREASEEEENKAEGDQEEIDEEGSTSTTELYDSELEQESELVAPVKYETMENATNRFAAVNLDWDKISAVDLLAVYRSFAPKNGVVKSVTIYPSEFGAKRLEEENQSGPVIFREDYIVKQDEDEEMDQEERKKREEEDGFDPLKLRKYELERLRYYFAICECDTAETAQAVVSACDGNEISRTGNKFDLSFVDVDTNFTREPKEVATSVPTNYTEPDWYTDALQHTKVALHWDETDHKRLQKTMRKYQPKEILDDADFEAYLASSSSSIEIDEEALYEDENIQNAENEDEKQKLIRQKKIELKREKIRKKYAGLLQELDENGNADSEEQSESASGEMVVSFRAGLGEAAQDLLKKKEESILEKNETVWETKLRKQKEKKEAKKKLDVDNLLHDDDIIIAGGVAREQLLNEQKKKQETEKRNKSKKTEQEIELEAKEKAELELLTLDEELEEQKKGYHLQSLLLKNKPIKKKEKEIDENNKIDDEFEINVEDDRFNNLFRGEFSIDPTDPKFKKTKNTLKLMQFVRENRPTQGATKQQNEVVDKNKIELTALVSSVKRKAEKRLEQTKKKKLR